MAQKRLAHPRGRVQRVAARQRSADMPRGQSVADGLRQGAHVLHIARPNHEQNHFPFIDIGDRGVRPRVAQNRLEDVRELLPVLRRVPADDPHGVDGGDVHVKNIRQAAHLHWLILKDRAHQLADDDAIVLV